MNRDGELAGVREQVSVLAQQVVQLVDLISRQDTAGRDSAPTKEKLELIERLMWKLHERHMRLKSDIGPIGRSLH